MCGSTDGSWSVTKTNHLLLGTCPNTTEMIRSLLKYPRNKFLKKRKSAIWTEKIDSFEKGSTGQSINLWWWWSWETAIINQHFSLSFCARVTLTNRKCFQCMLLEEFCDSQVIVKVTGEDTSSVPTVCWVLQVNWAPVSSFSAEYSSTEVVVERPVSGSTSTEAWMEIPRQKTNNPVWKP